MAFIDTAGSSGAASGIYASCDTVWPISGIFVSSASSVSAGFDAFVSAEPDTASSTSSASAWFDTNVSIEPGTASSTSSVSAGFDGFVFIEPDTASSTSSVSAGFDTRVFVEPELELVSSTSLVSAEFDTFVFVELDPVAAGAVTTVSVDFNTYWQPVEIVATSDVYVSFEFNTGFCDLEYAESVSFTSSQLQFSVLEANFTASVSSTVSTYADFDVELSVEYPLIPEDPTSTAVVTASFYVWKNQALSTLYSTGLLNPEIIDRLAEIGTWKFEATLGDRSDSVVWCGEGVAYLDGLMKTYADRRRINPRFSLKIESSVAGLSSSWSQVNLSDIGALKTSFIKYHGNVNVVDEWSNNA